MVVSKQSSTSSKDTPKKGKKITMSTNFTSPIKTNKKPKVSTWGNYIDVYETLVEPIAIITCTRMDRPEGSFITPMVRAFNDDEELASKWKILAFTSRRGDDDDAKPGERNAMLKNNESNYEWEAIVAIVDKSKKETASDVANHIAKQFSAFSKNDRQVRIIGFILFLYTRIEPLVLTIAYIYCS